MLLRGIIIRKTETGEHNQLVAVYTKELGKIRVLAKSAKKNTSKQAGHLDFFNLVDFVVVPGKNYPIITQTRSLENFLGIKSSFTKVMAGFFILESFHRLVYEEERDGVLWDFLNEQLNILNQTDKSEAQTMLADFKKGLLNVFGYHHNIGKEEIDYFLQSLSSQKFALLPYTRFDLGQIKVEP